MDFVLDRALRDAEVLVSGGIKSCIVENFWDSPFPAENSSPHVAACMASVLRAIQGQFGSSLCLGVNILRNDVQSALGVACAVGAGLVRANVFTGSTWTDQGLIHGRAHRVLQFRRSLGLDTPTEAPLWTAGRTAIAADVRVKHGAPAGDISLVDAARDAVLRGGADVLILTGSATGQAADPHEMSDVREALADTPVWVGSGVQPANAPLWRESATGAIVGSFLHRDGDLRAPLDPERVRQIADLLG